MASSRKMRSRVSSATAARPAAINFASAGSGMYSLAPSWIAATAAHEGRRKGVGDLGRRASRPLRVDDIRHRRAELLLDQNDFAARDQADVEVDVDRFGDLAVEFEHRAGAELERVADLHARAPKHGRDLGRPIEHRLEK